MERDSQLCSSLTLLTLQKCADLQTAHSAHLVTRSVERSGLYRVFSGLRDRSGPPP